MPDNEVPEMGTDAHAPIKIGKKSKAKKSRRIVLFELDGVSYEIPEKPTPAMVMKYLVNVRKVGVAEAGAIMIVDMLGQTALDALAASDDVEQEDITAIFDAISKIVVGGIQPSLGN